MKVLSIQSAVAHGHVGNSAAVFPLQRIGVEVLPVYTVNFSNHTGYGAWRGPVMSAQDVADVITGIEERGVFPEIDVVLSGYQGGTGIGDVIVDAVRRVKAANPTAIYACDPVMGNARSGCFVAPEIPELLRDRVVPAADLITPNQFELGYLTGTEPSTIESTLASADLARAMGPSTVLITSVERPDAEEGTLEMAVVDEQGRGSCRPRGCRSRPTVPVTSPPRCSPRTTAPPVTPPSPSNGPPRRCSTSSRRPTPRDPGNSSSSRPSSSSPNPACSSARNVCADAPAQNEVTPRTR